MPIQMTKKAINDLLVEERAKARSKQRRSAFMSRSRSIYHGQETRLREASGDPKAGLPYTLEEFRSKMDVALTKICVCCYCGCGLSVRKVTADHAQSLASGGEWGLDNLVFPCMNCNWQKGRMTALEFKRLLMFCARYLSPESAGDLKRRLSIGGKWSPR